MPNFDPTRPTMSDIATLCGFVQPQPPATKRNPFAPKPPVLCTECREPIDHRRANLGKTTCFDCQAVIDRTNPVKHLVAIPYNKGAYQHIHDPADLFSTNPKDPRQS